MKAWHRFRDECPHCGCTAEVFTAGGDNCAYDGDEARCIACHCPGSVTVDGWGDDDDATAAISWHDEPDCKCEWCAAQLAKGTQ